VRLLHTSDWHLGRTLVQTSLLDAQETFLDWLLDLAVEREVDAVLVSGDVYDRAVPSTDAVRLLDRTFVRFAAAGVPLVLVSGNHDSAVRLGFGRELSAVAGVHLRTSIAEIATPVVLHDEHGPVGIYGIPYLLPDAAREPLGAERTHESVLRKATELVLADAAERGMARTVVLSHAFVTGAHASEVSESERDVRVGGIGDAPASVFDGVTYVALGHLHRPQRITLRGSSTVLRYSGSPLAFSFSERDDTKSVALIELGPDGIEDVTTLPTPVPRPMRQVTGRLEDLLARATTDLADHADCWVKAVLTDASRPASPMERLRAVWPYTLVLDFQPDGERVGAAADLERLARTTDPVEICEYFVERVGGERPTEPERVVLREAVERAQQVEVTVG
jgi:exonuclease SbcD